MFKIKMKIFSKLIQPKYHFNQSLPEKANIKGINPIHKIKNIIYKISSIVKPNSNNISIKININNILHNAI